VGSASRDGNDRADSRINGLTGRRPSDRRDDPSHGLPPVGRSLRQVEQLAFLRSIVETGRLEP
jgi:hypothetical protein